MIFSLDQLRGFIAVATELHFGRAAEKLQMTQPPLSRQIQKLEAAIGVTLLSRNNRHVELTPAGEAFLGEARRLIALANGAPEIARRMATRVEQRIRVGFTAISAFEILGPLLGAIDETLPDIDVRLNELNSGRQLEALVGGELDLGLVRLPPRHSEFEARLVHREALLLAVPAAHPLGSDTTPIDVSQLQDADMLMYSVLDAPHFHDLTSRMMASVHPRSTQFIAQSHTMVALVRAGRGIAIVPASARAIGDDGVTMRPIIGWESEILELHAVWLRGNMNPALRRVVDILPEARPSTSASHRD